MMTKPRINLPGLLSGPLLVLVVAACFLVVLALLRELGYTLPAYLGGGSVLDFPLSLFDPGRRATVLGDFTPMQLSVQAAGSIALPLLAWLLFMLLVPEEASLPLELGKLFSSIFILILLLPWVGVPVLAMLGRAPAQWDAAVFLANTGLPPVWLTAAALFLLALSAWLAETRLAYWQSTWVAIRSAATATEARHHRLLSVFAFLAVATVALAFSINAVAHLEQGILPLGFHKAAAMDLQGQNHLDQQLYTLHVQNAQPVDLIVMIRGANHQYLAVDLDGPDDSNWTVIDPDQKRVGDGQIAWHGFLYPGDYNLTVDSLAGPGTLTVYTKGPY
jgi:hypothetical protein